MCSQKHQNLRKLFITRVHETSKYLKVKTLRIIKIYNFNIEHKRTILSFKTVKKSTTIDEKAKSIRGIINEILI